MASHDQPILFESNLSNSPSQVNMQPDRFVESIDGKGYDITIERSVRCPCLNIVAGQPQPNCVNCGGFGWFFYNKRKTRAVILGANRDTKFKSWSAMDMGRAGITLKPKEDIAFMDRIVNLDIVSTFSQALEMKSQDFGSPIGEKIIAQTTYPVLEVISIFLFIGSQFQLTSMTDLHYDIDYDKIILTPQGETLLDSLNINGGAPIKISVRYHHNPVFHVLEVVREQMLVRKRECSTGELAFAEMPIHAQLVRAQYLSDRPDILGNGLQDNSNINTYNAQY